MTGQPYATAGQATAPTATAGSASPLGANLPPLAPGWHWQQVNTADNFIAGYIVVRD